MERLGMEEVISLLKQQGTTLLYFTKRQDLDTFSHTLEIEPESQRLTDILRDDDL